MASAWKSNVKDVISAYNADVNKIIDKMLILSRNVLPRNVMQTSLGPPWGFSSKNHVQTAGEIHDLVVSTQLSFIWQWLQTAMCIGIYARILLHVKFKAATLWPESEALTAMYYGRYNSVYGPVDTNDPKFSYRLV